ncbi:MAG: two-component sensor histidine kinase [Betaproteobacteria bacterium]|nr:two-component sensor histidine kinase [Betaproteobacteria bacterium]
MKLSFRLRIALLSALLAGCALAGFAALTWWFVRDIRVRQLEADVAAHAERESRRRLPPAGWRQFEVVLARTLGAREPGEVLLLVGDADGATIYRSAHWPAGTDENQLPWPPLSASGTMAHRYDPRLLPPPAASSWEVRPDIALRPFQPSVAVSSFRAGGLGWRAGLSVTPISRVAVAMSLAGVDAEMAALRNAFLLAVPLALALIGLGAWIVAARALNPVQRLNASIRGVTAAGLDQRVTTREQDREFEELTLAFNAMLGRLEKSFKQASRFSADAAHELKTPLAILQGELEREINHADAGSRIQGVLSGILDEVRRLSAISRKLLLLSQADAAQLRPQLAPFDLSGALLDLAEDTRMLAPALRVHEEIAPGITVKADENLLTQILHNLVSNAIKYNVDGGWIRIAGVRSPEFATVVVSNASAGIGEEDRGRLFERFYRADRAHGRRVDGVGLGLSLSRELARAHGGDLELEVAADHAVHVRLTIPALAT